MIDSLITRWESDFSKRFYELLEQNFSPIEAYALLTKRAAEGDKARASVMLAAMLQSEKRLLRSQRWYKARLKEFSSASSSEKPFNLNTVLYFALEGLNLMDGFDFLKLTTKQYNRTYALTK